MEKGSEDFVEEPARSMDKTEKKTGDMKRRAIFTVAGAALGGLLGDALIGREELIFDYSYAQDPSTGFETEVTTYAYGNDRGGVFEDILGNDQFSDTYEFTSMYSIDVIPGDEVVSVSAGLQDVTISEDALRDIEQLGIFAPDSIREVVPYGAYEGTVLGGAGGFAADWASRKMKKKGKEEMY